MAKGEKKQKAPLFRRQGVMAHNTHLLRAMVWMVLAIMCAALAFTQLGFAGIGLDSSYASYAVILLLPIALSALLLGTLAGGAMGLCAGVVLYVHSAVMPLDYYELSFVTPFTSIVMLCISGILLGLLFALALHNDPPSRVKRIVYIALVCGVVAWMYSIGFLVNVMAQLLVSLVQYGGDIEEKVLTLALRMGDVALQANVDAALMTIACVIADFATRKVQKSGGNMGLRWVFGSWMAVVVLLAFMSTSAVSFAVVTVQEEAHAESKMRSEVNYLCDQIRDITNRRNSFLSLLVNLNIDPQKMSKSDLSNLDGVFSTKSVLEAYSPEEDGTILILGSSADADDGASAIDEESTVVDTDDSRFKLNEPVGNFVSTDVLNAISASLASGDVVQVVDDVVQVDSLDIGDLDKLGIASHIDYLYAKQEVGGAVVMMTPASMVFAERQSIMQWTTLSFLVLLLTVFALTFQLLNRVVARRIDEENKVLAQVEAGDLNARSEVGGTREFSSLTKGINGTVSALKGWIAEAEARMDAELTTAKTIQESALPGIFPPYPDIGRFDIYASMNAAKQVGGDFYDFFLIGDDCSATAGKLGFVIADVSGKGVPAALFMMKAKALLRDYVGSGIELGEAVAEANRQLLDGNDAGMFVTAWVGVLDYANGHVDYVNAGHNPPLLWQNGGWSWLRELSGMALGLFDFPYEALSLDCLPGDTFLLYTDGVTEAFDVNGEQYGEKRLLETAEASYLMHPRRLLENVRSSVAAHEEGAEQSDDITILTLEVGVPPEVTATLELPANTDQMDRVNAFLHSELNRRLCPQRAQGQLDIAVEELFVNVCHYAYPDATPENPGIVRVQRTYSAEPPSITVAIIDNGVPFNPLAKPDAVTPDDIADVPIGGLGILMAKRCVNDISYERVDQSNVITIEKRW